MRIRARASNPAPRSVAITRLQVIVRNSFFTLYGIAAGSRRRLIRADSSRLILLLHPVSFPVANSERKDTRMKTRALHELAVSIALNSSFFCSKNRADRTFPLALNSLADGRFERNVLRSNPVRSIRRNGA